MTNILKVKRIVESLINKKTQQINTVVFFPYRRQASGIKDQRAEYRGQRIDEKRKVEQPSAAAN